MKSFFLNEDSLDHFSLLGKLDILCTIIFVVIVYHSTHIQ